MAKIALIGNPNVGKSVIFNELTGLHQTIANFPGCTVEKKEGVLYRQDRNIEVIDLPGIYSLTPHSIDEKISRDYLIENKPDLVVDVIDASNLERNLYLTVQLIELGLPIIIVLNMIDLAEGKGISIDIDQLQKQLGIPIIPTIASQGKNIETVKEEICYNLANPPQPKPLNWPKKFEESIQILSKELKPYEHEIEKNFPTRWLAISLLEEDETAWTIAEELGINRQRLEPKVNEIINEKLEGDGVLAFVDARYDIINSFLKGVQRTQIDKRWVLSDMLDEVLTHRILGIPIFLAIMWGVFQLTFTVGAPLVRLIEVLFDYLGDLVFLLTDLMDGVAGNGHNPISEFIVGALIDGVGSVVVFLPYIAILFFAIAILEDSGYLSRVAFLMDKLMTKIGLHGHSFIPLLLGFGCNVPAIMATRAIKDKNARMTTIMINSFMSCGARLPVYILIAGTIFPAFAGLVTLGLYIGGIVVAILVAWALRKSVFQGETSDLVIELQPYTIPTPKSVFIKMWNQIKSFLKKASTIIFAAVAIIYLLNVAGILEYLGKAVAYMFWWMKMSNGESITWEYGAALISGLVAKEVVVGTLGTLLNFTSTDPGDPSLQSTIGLLGPAAGIGYLVFILLYAPCVATLAVIKQETNSWKWMWFSLLLTTVVAYAFAALAYFTARLIIGL